jgi:protein gp37
LLPVPKKLTEPIRWQKSKMIFVNSMNDLFHSDVPVLIAVVHGARQELPNTRQQVKFPGRFVEFRSRRSS